MFDASEHPVVVSGSRRDLLDDIPMLDDLAVRDAEDIDDGASGGTVVARGVHMQHDKIAFGDDLEIGRAS